MHRPTCVFWANLTPFSLENTAATLADPISGVLEYYRGGHLSQPDIMAENFHERARLCFSDGAGALVMWSREAFFEKVTKIVQGWPKWWANFRNLIGIFSQSVGPSLAIWVNPVQFLFTQVQQRQADRIAAGVGGLRI